MSLEIVRVPCLKDNYAWIAHDPSSGATAVFDVPDAAPILSELQSRGWTLGDIFITHHHWDHIDGVEALRAATGARVTGAAADAHRLPALDRAVAEGDTVSIGADLGQVIDVSGHTIGHIAFYFPGARVAFTADSLMGLGCGRLFEGTPAVMWQSLCKLAALPPETLIFSGHEYSAGNAKFALTIEPANAALISRSDRITAARARGEATIPVALSEELATNPFLRAGRAEVKRAVGLPTASDAESFAEIRRRKDAF